MTRINCIPPEELLDKHLLAEYRELPRIFKLARPAPDSPQQYVLGKGHCLFFYDKLQYLYERQCAIVSEMLLRGFRPTYNPTDLQSLNSNKQLWKNWTPTDSAQALNRARISERLHQSSARSAA